MQRWLQPPPVTNQSWHICKFLWLFLGRFYKSRYYNLHLTLELNTHTFSFLIIKNISKAHCSLQSSPFLFFPHYWQGNLIIMISFGDCFQTPGSGAEFKFCLLKSQHVLLYHQFKVKGKKSIASGSYWNGKYVLSPLYNFNFSVSSLNLCVDHIITGTILLSTWLDPMKVNYWPGIRFLIFFLLKVSN